MKTIEEAAKEYAEKVGGDNFHKIELENAFESGIEFAQQWIEISEDNPLPEIGDEVIVKNEHRKEIRKVLNHWDVKDITEFATHWRLI